MKSKFLKFEDVTQESISAGYDVVPGKFHYRVWNKKDNSFLGYINWYPKWRKYVFTSPEEQVIYDVVCLNDIVTFIGELTM